MELKTRFIANLRAAQTAAELRACERLGPGFSRAVQSRRLRKLMLHAHRNVPFYRKLWARGGVPVDRIRTADDLKLLPLADRGALASNGVDVRDASVPDDLSLFVAGPYRAYLNELWGLKRAAGHLYVLAGDVSQWEGSGQHMLPPTADREEIMGALSTLRPELVTTYPGVAASVACELAHRGIEPASVRVLQLTGEPLTRPVFRSIMKGFPRVRVVDTYTAGELGFVAFQCRPGGPYHVPATRVVVEVLAPDGFPAGPGHGGRVAITHLTSRDEPLIRYTGLGDWAVAGDRCSCGLLWPTLQRIDGPVSSWFVTEDGRRISSFVLMDAMEDVQGICHYQLVQKQKDVVEVRVVTDGQARSQAEQTEQVGAEVETALNAVFAPSAVRIRTTIHPTLPRDPGSGRTSVVVNQVA